MSKSKLNIMCDGYHDYIMKINGDKIKMKRSKGEHWTNIHRGELIGKLKDHGNGIKINIDNINLDLDYSTFMELYFLIHTKIKKDNSMCGKIEYNK